jgi:hypothetical protein
MGSTAEPEARRRSRSRERQHSAALIGILLALAPALAAQGDEGRHDVQGQIDALRAQNEVMAGRIEDLEIRLEESELDRSYHFGLNGSYGATDVSFQIFGDVGGQIANGDIVDEQGDSFALGSVDLVLNATIGERFRAFSETALDINESTDATTLGQERLWGSWTFADFLTAKLGTEHSPISRWNQLYHHGHWLETTIFRPALASFEGDGGVLPMHRTGLELSGSHFFGADKVEYFATVSNGRGSAPTDKQRGSDENDSKAIDVGLAWAPGSLAGLRVGAAYVIDRIPADSTSMDPDRGRAMPERITLANAEYVTQPIVLRSEFAWIEHDGEISGTTYDHNTGYLQAEIPVGDFTPYTRYDYREMDEGDPFYAPTGRDRDLWGQAVGVRYEPVENVALKLEVVLGEEDRADGSKADVVLWALQLSWWL